MEDIAAAEEAERERDAEYFPDVYEDDPFLFPFHSEPGPEDYESYMDGDQEVEG